MVEHLFWVQVVGGSNPLTPTLVLGVGGVVVRRAARGSARAGGIRAQDQRRRKTSAAKRRALQCRLGPTPGRAPSGKRRRTATTAMLDSCGPGKCGANFLARIVKLS